MSRPRIWVSQPLFDDLLAPLREHADVVTTADVAEHSPAQIATALRDVDGALVTLNERIDGTAIAQAQHLRAVANVGVGYNNLDVAALAAVGVAATNTPDVLTETTADFAWALLLATARRVTEAERWLRSGAWTQWSFDRLLGADVHGATLGILGMGRIGQAIARRAAGFDMRVVYHNRSRVPDAVEAACRARWVPFQDLLAEADHLVLVLPYSASSHHVIDAAALAAMKPTATLVNLARGGIVDDSALAEALAAGRIAGAGLDVFEGEPVVHERLLACDNVVLTPHIASASHATRRAMVALAVANLAAALGLGPRAGDPPNLVPGSALPRLPSP
ncbi:2-hydroxyacid dehydrogenase [Dokdonella sp. MW10]|uniref:2-hydroxyacid dehydrogenase n=1 Tax=Dokdonella sp. MW10 TaxID=2992926 RepID=UPI003F7DAE92